MLDARWTSPSTTIQPPFNKIVGELPEMRWDTMELVKKAMEEKRRAYVIVNNRSERNAPLTMQALTKALQG